MEQSAIMFDSRHICCMQVAQQSPTPMQTPLSALEEFVFVQTSLPFLSASKQAVPLSPHIHSPNTPFHISHLEKDFASSQDFASPYYIAFPHHLPTTQSNNHQHKPAQKMPKPTAVLKRLKALLHRGPPADVLRTHRSRHRRALSGDDHELLPPEAVTDGEGSDHQLTKVPSRDHQHGRERSREGGSERQRQRSRHRSGRVLEAEVPNPFADPACSEGTLTTTQSGEEDVISLAEAVRVLEPSGCHESSERVMTGGSAGENESRRLLENGAGPATTGDGASDESDEEEGMKGRKIAELRKKIARLNEMISEFGVKKRNCKAELHRLKADIGELRRECAELKEEIDEAGHED
ncbi:hypothetical protein BDY17DRAFT_159379 [Neohortaea acidophila]|uniref:Uncharacterized protein n=1 Tax=Neohortaea acidophila TaxID=245834 RepID=A0A6A6PT52_9PEZI|nr:uncharacterized protein BDY17DRAFT_159379 [Neohortaea acidophila]KAF2482407.1 hypothetical protein BDY17DRAFT_159379 [Neohortaea acidophila]